MGRDITRSIANRAYRPNDVVLHFSRHYCGIEGALPQRIEKAPACPIPGFSFYPVLLHKSPLSLITGGSASHLEASYKYPRNGYGCACTSEQVLGISFKLRLTVVPV